MKNRSKSRFLELSVPAFFDAYPEIAPLLPPAFVLELLSEPDYLVRFFLILVRLSLVFLLMIGI